MRILVIGATGNQGIGVIRHSVAAGHTTVALVTDPGKASAKRLQTEFQATLVQGNLDDASSLQRGMEGADAVFFISMPVGLEVELRRAGNVVDAAKASGSVSMVIFSGAAMTNIHESLPGWGPNHAMYQYWRAKAGIEELVRGAGFKHWLIVRPASFLQNFLAPISQRLFPQLEDDHVIRHALRPDRTFDVVDGSDVGRVVAAALSDPDAYSGSHVELAVETLTMDELAQKMHKVTGLPYRAEYVDADELAASIGERYVSAWRLFNECDYHIDVGKASREHGLTTTEEFFSSR